MTIFSAQQCTPTQSVYSICRGEKTSHVSDRSSRIEKYAKYDLGEVFDCFIVDTGHKCGLEIHSITDTGFIFIQNKNTRRLVTVLAARPGQILRYYKNTQMSVLAYKAYDYAYKRNQAQALNYA